MDTDQHPQARILSAAALCCHGIRPTCPASASQAPSGAENGEGGAPAPAKGRKGRRGRLGVGEYDYMDDFIDDSEAIKMFESDRRRTKYQGFNGFFMNRGQLERDEADLQHAPSPLKGAGAPRRPRAPKVCAWGGRGHFIAPCHVCRAGMVPDPLCSVCPPSCSRRQVRPRRG